MMMWYCEKMPNLHKISWTVSSAQTDINNIAATVQQPTIPVWPSHRPTINIMNKVSKKVPIIEKHFQALFLAWHWVHSKNTHKITYSLDHRNLKHFVSIAACLKNDEFLFDQNVMPFTRGKSKFCLLKSWQSKRP